MIKTLPAALVVAISLLASPAPAEVVQAHGRAYVLVRVLSDALIAPDRPPAPAPGPSRRFAIQRDGRCPGGLVAVAAVRATTRTSAGVRCVPPSMLSR